MGLARNSANGCWRSRVDSGNIVSRYAIHHICTRSLRGIITIPIFKGRFSFCSISNPRLILCDSGYTKRYEKAKNPIVENSIFEKERDNEKSGFGNHQKVIVGIHAFYCCGESLESFLSFVFRLLHTVEKKQSIRNQNTQSKSCKGIKRIMGKQEGNKKGKNPNKPTNGLQGMNMITVLKLLKKPIHLLLRMIECRHISSLKNLINYTYSIAFSTNHAK